MVSNICYRPSQLLTLLVGLFVCLFSIIGSVVPLYFSSKYTSLSLTLPALSFENLNNLNNLKMSQL